MILDHIENWRRYFTEESRFGQAFLFLEKLDRSHQDERIDLDGDRLYVMVQSYDTRDESDCRFETHKRYADIQFCMSGQEAIGWAPLSSLDEETPYDADRDVEFFGKPVSRTPVDLAPGIFAVFYPEDGHQPGVRSAGSGTIRKAVVKVLLD